MNPTSNNLSAELDKIEALHRKDMEASAKSDFRTLQSLLTKDAVMIPPESHWIRGEKEIKENYKEMEADLGDTEILEYRLEFEEIKILGEYAYEWGKIRGKSRSSDGSVTDSSYNVMRILKKTANDEWKVHRAIWNQDSKSE
ncbi:MAG: DUF4440 domain-containing protein [Balneolaceae bacterium]|nr:DUF4440 domain-containing protein [Balneolaceae bacterium]